MAQGDAQGLATPATPVSYPDVQGLCSSVRFRHKKKCSLVYETFGVSDV